MLGEDFTFDGISSIVYNAKMVRFGASGFLDEVTIGSANLTEVEYPNDFKPHLQKVTRSPLEFTKQIMLVDYVGNAKKWTEVDRQLIFNWLFHNEYKPLTFADRPGIVYNVIAISNLTLNTINERGYLDIGFKSNSPYPWKEARTILNPGSTAADVAQEIAIDSFMAIDKLYPTILLERIGTIPAHFATIVKAWTTASGSAGTIGITNSLIPTVTKILINTRYRTITDAVTNISLYRYKGATGFIFPYLIPESNILYIPKGWKATITFQEPIIY